MKSNAAELTTVVDYAVLDTRLNSHRHEVPAPIRLTEHYSLRGEVGAGGVGRVLLGFDERIGREVAIKEMHADAESMDPRIHARFVREAQITGRLEHPGIVPVYDLGATSKGSPFYVMRLVRGDTLSKTLAACTAGRAEAELAKRLQLLGTFIDICEAMAYAHSRGVVHRDLKPGNVVLGAFGETILLDWGLAKIAAEADAAAAGTVRIADERPADLTRQDAIMGTPAYMAPSSWIRDSGTSIRARMSSHLAVSFTSSWSVRRRSVATSTASWQRSARPSPCPPPARRPCRCRPSSSPSATRP